MQVNLRAAGRPRSHGRRQMLWLPAVGSLLGYALLVLLVLTSNAGAEGQRSLKVRFVERQGVVQPGAVAVYTASCPARAPRAVGPEFGSLSKSAEGQLALAGSFPSGAHTWTVLVKNLSAQAQGYYAGVTCLGAPGARYSVIRTSSVIDAQTDGAVTLRCPHSTPFPVSSTFQLQPGSAPGSAAASLTFSGTDKRGRLDGSQFPGMRNLTGAPLGVFLGALCTNVRVTNGNGGQSTVPPPGSDGFYSPCPRRRQLAIGGEFFTLKPSDSSTVVLTDFGVHSRGSWIVTARSLTSRPVAYDAYPVCIG